MDIRRLGLGVQIGTVLLSGEHCIYTLSDDGLQFSRSPSNLGVPQPAAHHPRSFSHSTTLQRPRRPQISTYHRAIPHNPPSRLTSRFDEHPELIH